MDGRVSGYRWGGRKGGRERVFYKLNLKEFSPGIVVRLLKRGIGRVEILSVLLGLYCGFKCLFFCRRCSGWFRN